MKNIITKLTQAGGVLVLALVLGIGASVFAVNYAGPTSTPPGNNAPVPINVKADSAADSQSKGDVLTPVSFDLLKIGGGLLSNTLKIVNGSTLLGNTTIGNFFSLEKLDVRAPAFFSNNGTTNNAQVKIGGTATTTTRDGGRIPPFTVDIANRSGWDGHDFLHVQTNQSNISSTGDTANASTNASIFGFWSDKNSRYADIWAGLPRFSRGNPNNGDVLTSYDTNGNANWGTINTGLDIKRIRAYKSGAQFTCEDDCELNSEANAFALCPSNYIAIGGGGDCEKQAIQVSQSIVNTSANNPFNTGVVGTDPGQPGSQVGLATGWYIQCKSGGSGSSSYGHVHVEVICAKNSNPTVTVTDPNAGTTTTPPPPTADWHDMTLPRGTTALQSCASWAASHPNFTSISNVHTFKDTSGAGTWVDMGQGCAYSELNSGGIWFCTTPLTARTNAPIQANPSFPTSSCSNGLNMKTMIYY